MSSQPENPWGAPARTLVLYCPKDQWRFAIYSDVGILDGYLVDVPPETDPVDAQHHLLARVQDETGLTYLADWVSDKPRWWSATLTVVSV